ncbi:MAG: tRNA pseudouridine(55) synthase TruB [Planctomycetes bacterium]|nr:tRNA pseudouridine(55) synthase TruB [Planctomycetota bacterium]
MDWCGILNVDKPSGLTSRQVVDRIQSIVYPAKVGHAGTLDPLATGVLVVCIGNATRLISRIQEGRKGYVARFVLGKRSDTDDVEGTVVDGNEWQHLSQDAIEIVCQSFIGAIQQTPPSYSAIKVKGVRSYKRARRGENVSLEPREVTIHSIRLTSVSLPEIEMDIVCGSGTYVRSIGRDLGDRLGCGAIMSKLDRYFVGPFSKSDAIGLENLNESSLRRDLKPPIMAVADFPTHRLTNSEITAVTQGRSIRFRNGLNSFVDQTEVVLIDENSQMIGLALWNSELSQLVPRLIFRRTD